MTATETPFTEQQMLAEVEKLGFTVVFQHIRSTRCWARHDGEFECGFAARGGYTQADIKDHKGRIFAIGIAHVSKRDNYNKANGRRLALHRALYGVSPFVHEATA